MAPAYSFRMSTTYSRPPCDFQRIVFSSEVVPYDVTTVYEERVKDWWSLCWMCWTDSDCRAPRARDNLGCDEAGLFYMYILPPKYPHANDNATAPQRC